MVATQVNVKNINNSIDQWIDIHFGDTSFNGRVVIGRRTDGHGIRTMGFKPLKSLRPYVKMLQVSPKVDYYITANTVTGIKRRKEDLFGLQNIVIDVDCHDNRQPQAINELILGFIWRCKRDLWSEGVIPMPNSIVRTGRGVQLWWAILPCYGGADYGISLYHHNKIKSTFISHIARLIEEYDEELEGLDVDRGASSNPVGYFRLPGSYNTKAKCYTSLAVIHDKRYDQRELTKLEAPEIRVSENASAKYVPLLESDRRVLQNYESTGVRRVIQLVKLRNLRNNEAGSEMRDYFNFSVYNALRMNYDHDEAMERLESFNAGFREPMTPAELENCVSSAEKKGGYSYKNETLIELLDVTPEEQQAIGLFPVRGFRRSKPNASRDEARRTLKEDRDSKILALVKKGVSQAETARILNIGKNTVGRVLKRLRQAVENLVENFPVEESGRHHNGSIYVLSDRAAESPYSLPEYSNRGSVVVRLARGGMEGDRGDNGADSTLRPLAPDG
jgi:DNA-binding CsgD family transcriptional regulator